jgi:hypothetical protein
VFHCDVAKVDPDVVHVAMAITNVSSVCSKCFIYFLDIHYMCFIWMLQMFHTYVAMFYMDVAYVCNGFQ